MKFKLHAVFIGTAGAALCFTLGIWALPAHGQQNKKQEPREAETWIAEDMPAGFGVEVSEIEGPVFTNDRGMTLYTWPLRGLRNGDVGDRKGDASNCTGVVLHETSGLMSPYPAGLTLPDVASRRSCQDLWPPVIAKSAAKPIGKWTIVGRKDGALQWAYDGMPLYTSDRDQKPGDVLGATNRQAIGDAPGVRKPVGPKSNVPPAFQVRQVATGRMVLSTSGFSVYSWDKDGANVSNCFEDCLRKWTPVLAGEFSQPQGEWTIIQRSPGVRQWAFRKKPLYTLVGDPRPGSLRGSDEAGWHNVYVQRAPVPPRGFTIQAAHLGYVLADSAGKTIYIYNCGDDALDQQACDHPAATQQYRIAVCGGGDPARCLATWPPVQAAADAKSPNRSWTTILIDPLSGRIAAPGQPGALRVWAYRGRPVYTFARDKVPGQAEGDAWGEFYAHRNGFKAFWLRDDFYDNAG